MQNKFQNKYRIPSARLQMWDYSNNGAYFITICTQNRHHFFGQIQNQKMQLSEIGKLAEKLAENKRINKVYFLQRTKSIDKLAWGGRRDKQIHLETISAVENMDITDNIILLMDDVTTTGNSLYACKEILMEKGAKQVEMFALGKAI